MFPMEPSNGCLDPLKPPKWRPSVTLPSVLPLDSITTYNEGLKNTSQTTSFPRWKKFLMENLIFCAANSLREKVDKIQFVLTSYFTVAHTNTQTHRILHKLLGESHVKT